MTGIKINKQEILQLLQNNPNSLIVVDEAYIDFIPEETVLDCINKYSNLIIIRTFSKSRSLAGLRIGYAIADVELINALKIIKNSYNYYPVNRLAIAAGIASLKDNIYVRHCIYKVIQEREKFKRFLEHNDFYFTESVANFLLIKHKYLPSDLIWSELKQNGISTRKCYQERIKKFIRVSIGTELEMQQLCYIILDIINKFKE